MSKYTYHYYTHIDHEWEVFSTGLSIAIKFCVSVSLFTVNLQMAETYPTCLRQTGLSLGMILSNVLGVLAPYAVLWVYIYTYIYQ